MFGRESWDHNGSSGDWNINDAEALRTILESFNHPAFIVHTETMRVMYKNEKAINRCSEKPEYCFNILYDLSEPCTALGVDCPIPLLTQHGSEVVLNHIVDVSGVVQELEIHAYAILDGEGLPGMFAYVIDKTKIPIDIGLPHNETSLLESLIAHDLKNELQIALNHIETAKILSENAHEFSHEILDPIHASLVRIRRLIEAKEDLQWSGRSDIHSIVETTIHETKRIHPQLSIEFDNKSDVDELEICPGILLNLVLESLLANTVEHAADDAKVNLILKKEKQAAIIIYQDNGPGIPYAIRDNLFTRGASTRGRGLGLYLVRKVIDAHGGSINLVNQDTPGTTLRIEIPLA